MNSLRIVRFLFILWHCVFSWSSARAGGEPAPVRNAPKVYVDGENTDMDFIRKEIPFVNYVVDRKEADVHVLITNQDTGSGGEEFTLTFLGQSRYRFRNDTLTYATGPDDTEDAVRNKMTRYLKLGLASYAAKSPVGMDLSVSYSGSENAVVKKDSWNNWLFRAQIDGHFDGEKYVKSTNVYGSISANRITEVWKIRLALGGSLDEYRFRETDSTGAAINTINSTSKSKNFSGLVVRGISEHWSVGFFADAYSSTYSNILASYGFQPAIEYDVFPYSQSTRREFRILYQVGPRFRRYIETTIYDKNRETLFFESLQLAFEIKQPWGNVETSILGSNALHDFSKNRIEIQTEIALRLFKGFSFTTHGGLSVIHDQLSLPKGEVEIEDLLLRRRQLETQYSYWFMVGFEYAFGSIYNNIVNPRFGSY
jgi:hypothetical protein